MKTRITLLSALLAIGSGQLSAQTDTLSSVALTGTGVATVTERIGVVGNQAGTIGNSLAGIAYVAGDVPLDGSPNSVAFYALSVSGPAVPPTAATAFTSYGALTFPSQVDTYADVAAKLGVLSPAGSYSGLTFAADDLGFGSSFQFYMINHRSGTDYFAQITPGTGTSSLVRDLKPMSWPGGVAGTPANTGLSGYFALAYASTPAASYPANSLYYLRTDSSNHTQFGYMIPALTSGSFDTIDLDTAVGAFGVTGYSALTWMTNAIGGNPANQFYYLRQDNGPGGTGFTILGRLDPSLVAGTRTISDIANLGGVFDTLTYCADATGTGVGWGSTQFFATGALTSTAQSISFAAIPDRLVSAGSFTVTPSASSGLALTLTVVAGSTGTVSISGPVAGVFTITPLTTGVVTLQAKQSGPGFTTNWLNQSFNVVGVPVITNASTAAGTVGTPFAFTATALGSPTSFAASPLPAGLVFNPTTGVLSGTPTAAAVTAIALTATNAIGTSDPFTLTITVAAAGVAPIITNSPLTAAGTVGTPFNFAITASGTPTSYTASPLPAGLVFNTTTGVFSGTPTAAAVTPVALTATNGTGTGNATLTITVAAAGVAPVITNSPLTAAGTVGTPFSFAITASGSPTGYTASPLPAGVVFNTTTGVFSGTPTAAAVTAVAITATNGTGTDNATLTITVAAAGAAPVITNSPLTAAGTVGTPFSFAITASGSPTGYTASPLPAGVVFNTTTGVFSGTPTAAAVTAVAITATNSTGTGNATLTITVAAAGVAPIITNSPLTAAGTVGTPFSFAVTASGSPTGYTASPRPAGVVFNTTTGVFSGTPTAAAVTAVALTATNGSGTGNATLTITIAAAGVAPIITNSPLTAGGTVGTPFSFAITASGSPTAYTASPLPAGVVFNATTGVLSGTPTAAAATAVALTATNSSGTGNATLTITVAAAGVAPVITNSSLTAAVTVGTPFSYAITASGTPTSYTASPLPAGIVFNATTGVFSGTPTASGVTNVAITATNSSGTTSATLTITVAAVVVPVVVPPAIHAVLPLITAPITNWSDYKPAQIKVVPVPGVDATFDMVYHTEGTYTVGVGTSVVPGESLVTVARGSDIDLIVSLMENGIKEYDVRIRGNVVTTTVKAAVGLCGTIEQPFTTLPGSPNLTSSASVVSTVLFLYDEATAAATDTMSLEAYGIAVVENANLVVANSGVTNLRWKYAGAVKATGYTSTGDTLADLNAMGDLGTPLGALVREQGNQAAADQVQLIFNGFRADGASGRAEEPGHNSTVYWQTPWYVFVHQLGHNFGALHDRAYSKAADGNNVYRYGFVWTHPLTVTGSGGTTTTQVGYGTIMSYWGLEYIQPNFSNPNVSITYVGNYNTSQEYIETRSIGVDANQPKAADNARGLREAAVAMAGYRVVAGPPPSTVPATPPPPAVVVNERPGKQGGDLSLWFYAAIAGLGLLRQRFGKR